MKKLLPLLLISGCTVGSGAPPDQGPGAYLVFEPPAEAKGWAAIGAMRAKLPLDQRRRIRTAGLAGTGSSEMYVEFDGSCSDAADFVAQASRIAREAGIPTSRCSMTLPGAL